MIKSFKKDYPSWDISQMISLSTDCKNLFLTDKELYGALKVCKDRMDADVTSLNRKDILEILDETEDLFKEVDYDSFLDELDENWNK